MHLSVLDLVQLNTLLGGITPMVLQVLIAQHLSANRKRIFAFGFCLVVSLVEFVLNEQRSVGALLPAAVTLFGASTAMYHAAFEGHLGALEALDPIGDLLLKLRGPS